MRKLIAMIAGVLLGAGLLVSAPSSAVNIGDEGCTPGYWKNHTDSWEEASPSKLVGSAFTAASAQYADDTFLQALSYHGGSGADGAERILLRAAVAAWLNAAHEGVGYPYRRFGGDYPIVPTVDAALASGDRATMLQVAATLDEVNNLGCTLD